MLCVGTRGRAKIGVAVAASMIRTDWSCMFVVVTWFCGGLLLCGPLLRFETEESVVC